MSHPNEIEILLVEDNQDDLDMTLRAFSKSNLVNKIEVARDGAEALEMIFCTGAYAGRQINTVGRVVLLDLKLPKVDGLEVLRRIKSDPRTQAIPVIVLTSSREQSDVIASYRFGVNSFIVKPVDFDRFVHAVQQVGIYWMLINHPPK